MVQKAGDHHLRCFWNPVNNGISTTNLNWLAGFLPSTVVLGGGFKYTFFNYLGKMFHFDSYFSDGLKPPTYNNSAGMTGRQGALSSTWKAGRCISKFLWRFSRKKPIDFLHEFANQTDLRQNYWVLRFNLVVAFWITKLSFFRCREVSVACCNFSRPFKRRWLPVYGILSESNVLFLIFCMIYV